MAIVPLGNGEPIWVPSDSAATGLGVFQWTPDGNGGLFHDRRANQCVVLRLGAPAQTKLTSFSDAVIFTGCDFTGRPSDDREPRRPDARCIPDYEIPLASAAARAWLSGTISATGCSWACGPRKRIENPGLDRMSGWGRRDRD